MKKLLLSLFMVVVAIGVAKAETVTFDLSATAGYTNAQEIKTLESGSVTLTLDKGTGSNTPKWYAGGEALRIYQKNTIDFATSSATEVIKSVIFTFPGATYVFSKSGEYSFNAGDYSENGVVGTWMGESQSFRLTIGAAAQSRVSKIEVVLGEATGILAPVFSPAGGTFYEAQDVAISCATAGAVIHYTVDGTEPTAASATYSTSIKVEATTTIKAVAVKDGKSSEVTSATYNVAVNVDNIAKFYELSKESAAEFTNPVNVLYQNGIYLFVQDATGALQIYGAVGQTYKNGDVIPAGFRGIADVYAGAAQLASPVQASFKAGTTGATIAPTIVTAAQVTNDMANRLIKIGNVSVASDGKSITDASGSLNIYSRFTDVTIPQDEKKYDITAIVNLRNGDIQLFPTNFTESQNVGIAGTESDNAIATVFAGDKAIKIDAAESAQVLVVNTVGQVVASKTIAAGANTVEVPAGLYLVKVNNAVTKVIIK